MQLLQPAHCGENWNMIRIRRNSVFIYKKKCATMEITPIKYKFCWITFVKIVTSRYTSIIQFTYVRIYRAKKKEKEKKTDTELKALKYIYDAFISRFARYSTLGPVQTDQHEHCSFYGYIFNGLLLVLNNKKLLKILRGIDGIRAKMNKRNRTFAHPIAGWGGWAKWNNILLLFISFIFLGEVMTYAEYEKVKRKNDYVNPYFV